jgi:transposase
MLRGITEKPLLEDTSSERVELENTLYDLVNVYILNTDSEITYDDIQTMLTNMPEVKKTIQIMYKMHYKEMGNERYNEVLADIENLNNSTYIMTISEIMCDNEGASFLFNYDREEIDEQIAKCSMYKPSKRRKQLPYSYVDGNVRTYTNISGDPDFAKRQRIGGKRKSRKTGSKSKSKSKSKSNRNGKKTKRHATKHSNKKNKRHLKKHTKRM